MNRKQSRQPDEACAIRNTMKSKLVSICTLLVVAVSLPACTHNLLDAEGKQTYREVAWAYLTAGQKATVTSDWREAPVAARDYRGEILIWVVFSTVDEAILGPIIVLIEPQSRRVVGIAPRR